MKVALYPRVSTQEQANEGYSISEQIDRMKSYCDALEWSVTGIYTDAGYSGGTMNRPGLQRMIKDVKAGKIEKVLVYKLDRLSRSQLDTLYLIEKVFITNGVDFVSMCENFDTSTPFGKAMIGVLAVFAQLEREQIKERTRMGRIARNKTGKYYGGGKQPIGYDYINGELKINEFESIQIKKIYQLALKNISPYQITEQLKQLGYTHKHGNWNEYTVRSILNSKLYSGYVSFEGQWEIGIHKPIIDETVYNEVQDILKMRSELHNKFNQRSGKATTYLGGFLYCGSCGAKYSKNSTKRKRKDGSTYIYNKYSCNSRMKRRDYMVKNPNCKNKHWDIDELTELVFGEIRKLSLEPTLIETNTEQDNTAVINSEIERIEKQISKYMELYSLDQIPIDLLQTKINDLNNKKITLETELEQITTKQQNKLNHEQITQTLKSFDEILQRGTFEEIRAVIGELIQKIVIDGDDITIYWNFN